MQDSDMNERGVKHACFAVVIIVVVGVVVVVVCAMQLTLRQKG